MITGRWTTVRAGKVVQCSGISCTDNYASGEPIFKVSGGKENRFFGDLCVSDATNALALVAGIIGKK